MQSVCAISEHQRNPGRGTHCCSQSPKSTALDFLVKSALPLSSPTLCLHPKFRTTQHFAAQLSRAKQPVCYWWADQIQVSAIIKGTNFDQIFLGESPCLLDLLFLWFLFLLKINTDQQLEICCPSSSPSIINILFSEGKRFLVSKHCMGVLSEVLHKTSVRVPINCSHARSIFIQGHLFSTIATSI